MAMGSARAALEFARATSPLGWARARHHGIASRLGTRAEGQDSLSPLQSVAAGAARWGRFGGAPRSAAAGAVRAAHFVNILIATV
jgi:hypothetical protein